MVKSSRIKGKESNPDQIFFLLKEKPLNFSKSSNSNPESLRSWGRKEKKETKSMRIWKLELGIKKPKKTNIIN